MERTLNITVDNISSMENWEKEALLKTLLRDVDMEFKFANLIVSLYNDTRIYKGNILEDILQKNLKKV